MPAEPRVMFATAFESLFSKKIRSQLTPAVTEHLRGLGVDLGRPFQAGYPVETFAAALYAVSDALYPARPRPEALYELGHAFAEGFAETLLGKAAFGLMKLMGPVRSLERAVRTYSTANNYTQVQLTRLGPTAFDFHLNEQHILPQYDMGIITGVLERVGAPGVHVTLQSADAEGFTLHIEWPA